MAEAESPLLAQAAYAFFRVVVGVALVPHGLRACFGWFPGTGPVIGFRQMAIAMAASGYRPGVFWAIVAALVMFVAGPLLAVGWHTRAAAAFVCVFLMLGALDKARTHGYFCNRNGLEFPLLWSICALFFVAHGGGPWSVDSWLASSPGSP